MSEDLLAKGRAGPKALQGESPRKAVQQRGYKAATEPWRGKGPDGQVSLCCEGTGTIAGFQAERQQRSVLHKRGDCAGS